MSAGENSEQLQKKLEINTVKANKRPTDHIAHLSHLNNIEFPVPKDDLYQLACWFWRSSFLILSVFLLFFLLLTSLRDEGCPSYELFFLNLFHLRMICADFDYNWSAVLEKKSRM
jgi:hypothetical protein